MATYNTKITLFDIPSALPGGKPVSPFTIRVRAALNYKGLSFKTEFVQLHEIRALCEKRGFKHTRLDADGSPRYTLPVILDETSGTPISVSDSLPIIQYLDSTYPDPARPLFPSSDPKESAPAIYLIAQAYFMTNLFSKAFPLILFDVYETIVAEDSKEYWLKNVTGGKGLEAVGLKKGSEGFKIGADQLKDSVKTFTGFFEHNKAGPWILGAKPTFLDFVLLSCFRMVQLASPDLWKEIEEASGGKWGKFIAEGDSYIKL